MGPKEYDRLQELGHSLEKLIDWGYFTFISRPLLWLLLWIHSNVVHNYGWAIVLMTILLKLILLPMTIKSHKSMKTMQVLNPKVQAIRKKYKGKMRDKQGRYNTDSQKKMNEEMQALYKAEGVNPAGGCLPMLVQLPVFFGFYRLLSTTIQIKGAAWFAHLGPWSWIADLSTPDPLYILPLVMGTSQLLQQRQAPMSGDATQRAMMKAMPIAFTFFALTFPSGLVLYWLTNNILHIVQVGIYNKDRRKALPNLEGVKAMSRKYFSGKTIETAILDAASHFEMSPDEVLYRKIEKKHGFTKTPKVVIVVDPDNPKKGG